MPYTEQEICVYCGSRNVSIRRTDAHNECLCDDCHRRYYREFDARKRYLEYRTARRVMEAEIERYADRIFVPECKECGGEKFTTEYDNDNGYTYTCKKCGAKTYDPIAKSQLDALYSLQGAYPDEAGRDPIIQYLFIRLISKNYRVWNDRIRYHLGQAERSVADRDDAETAQIHSNNVALLISKNRETVEAIRSSIQQYVENSDGDISVEDVYRHIESIYRMIDRKEYIDFIKKQIDSHRTWIAKSDKRMRRIQEKKSLEGKEKRKKRAKVAIAFSIIAFIAIVAVTAIYFAKPTLLFGECKLEYYMDGDNSDKESTDITFGKYMQIDVPQKTGYTFVGLYDAAENGNMVVDAKGTSIQRYTGLKHAETVTLYARWTINTYNIVLNAGGGIGSDTTGYNVVFGNEMQNLPADLVKEGYTFKGWSTASGALIAGADGILKSEYRYLDDTHYDIPTDTLNLSINAVWEVNKYSLNLEADGGAVQNKLQMVPFTQTSIEVPDKVGYTFMGWYYNDGMIANEEGKLLQNWHSDLELGTTYTITAKWNVNTYGVYMDKNDGSGESATYAYSVTYNENMSSLSTGLTRVGYTFDGWGITNGLEDIRKIAGSDGAIYEDKKILCADNYIIPTDSKTIVLYAQWKANEYIVTLDANGGTCGQSSCTVTYMKPYGELPIPSKNRYVFIGWFTEKVNGDLIKEDLRMEEVGDFTVYAHWISDTITITDLNSTIISETDQTKSKTYKENKVIDIDIPKELQYMQELGRLTVEINITTSEKIKYRSNNDIPEHKTAQLKIAAVINNVDYQVGTIAAEGGGWPTLWVNPAYGNETNAKLEGKVSLKEYEKNQIGIGYCYQTIFFQDAPNWAGGIRAVCLTAYFEKIECKFIVE